MAYGSRQLQVRAYRGQIPSPGRPSVAWREDRVRFWAAIATGALTDEAAVAAGVSSPVGYRWFRHAGGVNPQLPPAVSGRYLSFSEREEIALLHVRGHGVREIARRIGRDPATISRELRRGASTRTYGLDYKATIAQWHAERRARRPKLAKLVVNDRLRDYVQDRLAGRVKDADGSPIGPDGPKWIGRNKPHRGDRRWVASWSPEQIANRLKADFPDDASMRISHEAIYTRRSTRPSTSRAAARSSASSSPACAPDGRCGFRGNGRGRRSGRTSLHRSSSASGPPRLPTEPFPVTGKAT